MQPYCDACIIKEEACFFGEAGRLFGVHVKPGTGVQVKPFGVLLLLPYPLIWQRMPVTLTRSLATFGFNCFRFDIFGDGFSSARPSDSICSRAKLGRASGRSFYHIAKYPKHPNWPNHDDWLEGAKEALDCFDRLASVRRYVLIGYCGTSLVIHWLMATDERVCGAVLINSSMRFFTKSCLQIPFFCWHYLQREEFRRSLGHRFARSAGLRGWFHRAATCYLWGQGRLPFLRSLTSVGWELSRRVVQQTVSGYYLHARDLRRRDAKTVFLFATQEAAFQVICDHKLTRELMLSAHIDFQMLDANVHSPQRYDHRRSLERRLVSCVNSFCCPQLRP